MDSDAVIGRLYRALLEAEEAKKQLMGVVTALKQGEMSLDRITLTPTGLIIDQVEEVAQ